MPSYADTIVNYGDEITLGSIRLSVIHTPGHTPLSSRVVGRVDARILSLLLNVYRQSGGASRAPALVCSAVAMVS